MHQRRRVGGYKKTRLQNTRGYFVDIVIDSTGKRGPSVDPGRDSRPRLPIPDQGAASSAEPRKHLLISLALSRASSKPKNTRNELSLPTETPREDNATAAVPPLLPKPIPPPRSPTTFAARHQKYQPHQNKTYLLFFSIYTDLAAPIYRMQNTQDNPQQLKNT